MTESTVPRIFDALPRLREDLLRIRRVRRKAKDASRESKLAGYKDESLREEAEALWAREARLTRRSVDEVLRIGGLQEMRALTVSEARRLPEACGGLPYGEAWDEVYLVSTAAKVFGASETEVKAALYHWWRSPEGKLVDMERNKRRAAARLKSGYWQKPKILKAKRERAAKARASMTEEQRAEQSRLRSERRRAAKARDVKYVSMLDDEPAQRVA